MFRSASLACLLTFSLPLMAGASSSDAWEEFRAEVKKACLALAPTEGAILIEVNPFGSESFGTAILYHQTETGLDRYVCVYGKQSQQAELSAAFPSGGN